MSRPPEPDARDFPPITSWQFAVAVLSEWRRTVAAVIIVLILGWPTTVIVNWLQDAGVMPGEQNHREAEHTRQLVVLHQIADGVMKHAINTERQLELLESHDRASQNKDVIIAHLLLEDCEKEIQNKARARRCARLEKLLESYKPNASRHEAGH